MSTGIAPVTNKLHSANHLTHCEESQELCNNNTSSCQLGGVEVVPEAL
jgi:hypothetical protein